MKIEIDTDKLTWTEVPGKPTVGSFLQMMTNPQSRGKNAPATKLPAMHGWVIVKMGRPSYAQNSDLGLVPTGTTTDYRFLQFPQQLYHTGQQEFPPSGAERIVAYSNDFGTAVVQLIGALHSADRAATLSMEKPAPVAAPATPSP